MNLKSIKRLCLVLISILLLSGCGANNESKPTVSPTDSPSATMTIATSFYPMYIFALNVAKDIPNVTVINMTQPSAGCLHDYAATPQDLKNLEAAKVLITNGADMESFMDKITSQMPNLKIIEASQGIELIKGDGDEGDNPHVWVSISNAITEVQTIGGQLAILDPNNATKYQENTNAYIKKLEAQRDKMHLALDGIKTRDIVTFHEAFPYFAQEFNFNIAAVIEREPGSAPNAKELSETIAQVKDLKITALFAEPQYPVKAAETVATATGAKIYTLDPVVMGPMEADAYINIMDSNLKTLLEALQ